MRTLLKSASWYLLGSILTNAIGFLIIPVITNQISTADFGKLSLVLLIVNFIAPIINFGTSGAVSKQFYQVDSSQIKSYIFNAALISTCFFLLLVGLFLVFGRPLADHFDVEYKFFIAIPFLAFGGVLQQFLLAVLRMHRKPIAFSIISIFGGLLNLSLGYLFVVALQAGWEGRLKSLLILNILLVFICVAYLVGKRYMSFQIDRNYLKEIFNFGLPIFVHLLSVALISFTDQVFISIFLSDSSLGIYSLAARLVFPISVIRVSILNAIDPVRYELLTQGDLSSQQKLVKILATYFSAIVVLVILGIIGYKFIFPIIFSPEYQAAFKLIIPLSMIVVLEALYNSFAGQIYFLGKTKVFMNASFFNIALNITLNYLLITRFGLYGAAMASLASKAVYTVIVVIVSHKMYQLPWGQLFLSHFKKVGD